MTPPSIFNPKIIPTRSANVTVPRRVLRTRILGGLINEYRYAA
ncbi:hypothetical protein [Streptomyces sp. M2CJ-2]|nr:hypothetical protein [Streptomyces sp. M2CJ-2]